MTAVPAGPVVTGGVLHLDGRPRLLLAGDYPYYRDDPQRWPAKLAALREAGIEVVTCYVPWRHHEVDGGYVFTGPGNRNLVGFLDGVARAGLLVLAKPGPHVHAELPVGGLPDRVSPTVDPRRLAALAADGTPLHSHGVALPSPADPAFDADVADWLAAVGDALRPWQYPRGPLVAVQVGNEGTYGETALPIDKYDYARVGVGAPRGWVTPATPEDLRPYLRWGAAVSRRLRADLRGYADRLGLDVPAYANLSAPARADRTGRRARARYDAWLVRGHEVSTAADVHYGFTSWVGDTATDDEALVNHVLAAARGRGPSLEENWSLSWVDPAWKTPARPIFNGLLGLACGATGLTVYTACATAGWGPHLAMPDAMGTDDPAWIRPPYGDAAPIMVDGTPGTSLPALRTLTAFLAAQGTDLVMAVPGAVARWYVQREHAAIAAWQPPADARTAGHRLPAPLAATLPSVVRACLHHGVGFALLDGVVAGMGGNADPAPPDGPLVTASAFLMAAADQRRLARFVAGGGALLLLGELPSRDESFRPCTVLADAVDAVGAGDAVDAAGAADAVGSDGTGDAARDRGPGRITVLPTDAVSEQTLGRWLAAHAGAAGSPAGPDLIQSLRRTRDGDVFVSLFRRVPDAGRVETEVDGVPLVVDLAGYGVAVLRLSRDRIVACYVKGIDERSGAHAAVRIRYGADLVASSEPCDLSLIDGGGIPVVRHTGGPTNQVGRSPLPVGGA